MVSRYFILSGIPMNQITMMNEIQNMISYLVENLRPTNSDSAQEEGMVHNGFPYEKLILKFFFALEKMSKYCN